jgi:hypothetical protein
MHDPQIEQPAFVPTQRRLVSNKPIPDDPRCGGVLFS